MNSQEHKHLEFEITIEYYKDAPAKILSVRCSDCKEESKELIQLLQSREDELYALFGNRPHVAIVENIDWFRETVYTNKYQLQLPANITPIS